MIFYEMKKIFSHRYLIPAFLLLMVLAFYSDVMLFIDLREYVETKRTFYQEYGGILTEEKYKSIQQMEEKDDDVSASQVAVKSIVVSSALNQITYMTSLRKTNESILNRAKENITYFTAKDYPGLCRLNQQIIKRYAKTPTPYLVPEEDWEYYFTYNRFLAFPILLIVLAVSNIFSNEHESNLYPVIKASKKGLRTTFWAKLTTAGICSAGIMLIFIMGNLAVKSITGCLYGWNAPIRSVPNFEYSWLDLSILQTVILFGCCMCLGAFIFGVLAAAISSFLHNNLFSLSLTLVYSTLTFLWFYIYKYYLFATAGLPLNDKFVSSLTEQLRMFMPAMLLEPFEYFDNYHHVMIFSYPFERTTITVILSVLITIFITGIAYKKYISSPADAEKRRWKNAV